MTRQLLIHIDVDGVLADFAGEFIKVANWIFHSGKQKITVDQVTNFDFAKCGILTDSQVATLFAAIAANSNFTRCLPVLPGAREALAELRELGRVVAVTSPQYRGEWVNGRVDWLKGLGFSEADIVFCKDKSLVHGDLLIDDGAHNVLNRQAKHAFLVEAPWNADIAYKLVGGTLHGGTLSSGTLTQAVDFARKLAGKTSD